MVIMRNLWKKEWKEAVTHEKWIRFKVIFNSLKTVILKQWFGLYDAENVKSNL